MMVLCQEVGVVSPLEPLITNKTLFIPKALHMWLQTVRPVFISAPLMWGKSGIGRRNPPWNGQRLHTVQP